MPKNLQNKPSKQIPPIDQTTLNAKMQVFLSCLGESFPNLKPDGNPDGECSGNSFMLFRADVIGEREHYFARKYFLASMEDHEIKELSALYTLYDDKQKLIRGERASDLQKKLEENDNLASHLKKDANEIRKYHYAAIRIDAKKALNLDKKNKNLLNFAVELYYYIHSLIAAQEIQDFNLMDETETTAINQKDYLEILNLLPPDRLLQSSIEKTENKQKQKIVVPKKEFEFFLHFTESELIDTINDTIFPRDFVRLASTNHTMYFRRMDSGNFVIFNFFDTNSKKKPPEIFSVEELVKKIKSRFFTNFKLDATWMPVYIQALNRESKYVRPTAEQLLDKIFKARSSQSNINVKSWDGTSTLLLAVGFGCIDVVKNLLERGADINQIDKNGCSPLTIATHQGYTDIVELLLKHNADPNLAADDKTTPLSSAIKKNRVKILEKLLTAKNIDIDIKNAQGATMLYVATFNGNPKIISLLLSKLNEVHPDRWPSDVFAEITKPKYIQDAIETIQKLNQLALDIKKLPDDSDPSQQMAIDALKKLTVDTWQKSGVTFEFTEAYQKLQQAYEAFNQLNNSQLKNIERMHTIVKIFSTIAKDYKKPSERRQASINKISAAIAKAQTDFSANPFNDHVSELENTLRSIYSEVVEDHKNTGDLRFFGSLQGKSTLQSLMEKAAAQCNFDIAMKSISPVKRLSGSI